MTDGALNLNVALVGYETVVRTIGQMPNRVMAALARETGKQAAALHRHIVADKLTGQVLNVVTGALRRSVQFRVSSPDPSTVVGEVFTNGTVPYARIHEYGGIILPVHAKMLSWVGGDGIRHFAHRVHMPERSYMRSALADMRAQIVTALGDAVRNAAREIGERTETREVNL